MIKTILFDLDGTLLNTIDDLADAANWVCTQHGWPTFPVETYKHFVGNGIPKLVERFSPAEARTPEQLAATLAEFSARYDAHKEDKTAPYPGIPELLAALKAEGIQTAVFSNKADAFCGKIIEHYFGPGSFSLVRGSRPGVPTKPDPAGVYSLMADLGAAPESTLFVGDSDVDILTGHNAGLPALGVLWGFRGEAELTAAGADALAAKPEDILAYLRCENTEKADCLRRCAPPPCTGLWLPASASCLGRHSRLAGHGPNNDSLFLPLAAVVIVAIPVRV